MENKRLFGKISCIHRQLIRENHLMFSEQGITPAQVQAMVFVHVKSREGEKVCQRDVEKRINLRPSSVSTLLANLEKDGYLVRSYAESDARTKYLELTEKGKELCEQNKILMEKCDAAVERALTQEECAHFERLLNKIIENIT